MRARAELIAAAPVEAGAGARLVRLRDAPPVAWRVTPDAVYVVGTAATPAGDDAVEIDLTVDSGASLRVRSTAATVVWRSRGTAQRILARIADAAQMDWQMEPMIATGGCCHRQHVVVELRGSAELRWLEEVVLGRHGETPGGLDLRIDVELDGIPLLRHQMCIGPSEAWQSPAVLGTNRTVGLLLQVGPSQLRSSACGPGWARMPLEGPGTLAIAVAADLPGLRESLAAALAAGAGGCR